MSLSSSTHENKASANKENGHSDRFGAVRTMNKTIDGIQQSREIIMNQLIMANLDMQSVTTRNRDHTSGTRGGL